jgi:hypothetical protein
MVRSLRSQASEEVPESKDSKEVPDSKGALERLKDDYDDSRSGGGSKDGGSGDKKDEEKKKEAEGTESGSSSKKAAYGCQLAPRLPLGQKVGPDENTSPSLTSRPRFAMLGVRAGFWGNPLALAGLATSTYATGGQTESVPMMLVS